MKSPKNGVFSTVFVGDVAANLSQRIVLGGHPEDRGRIRSTVPKATWMNQGVEGNKEG